MYFELIDEEDVRDAIEQIHAKIQEREDDDSGYGGVNHLRIQLQLPLRFANPSSLKVFWDHVSTHLEGTPVELHISSSPSFPPTPPPPQGAAVISMVSGSGGIRVSSAARTNSRSTEELACILSQVPNLHLLEINDLTLQGHDHHDSIQNLKRAISSQQQLRNVYWQNMQHTNLNINLKPLAEALCGLPHLQTLELYQVKFSHYSVLNAQSLAHIAQYSHAKNLEIMPCESHDIQEQGVAIGQGLVTNQNQRLEELSLLTRTCSQKKLSIMFQDPVVASMGRVLAGPLSRLERLQLNVGDQVDLAPLAEGLRHNTSLKTLSLCWDCPYDEDDKSKQPRALSRKNLQALRRVLKEDNFCLERLDITLNDTRHGGLCQEWRDPEIDFGLKLNQLGRQSLLRGQDRRPTMNDWILTLTKCQDDLSSFFYFLSVNPQLCYESFSEINKPELNTTGTCRWRAENDFCQIPPSKRQRQCNVSNENET